MFINEDFLLHSEAAKKLYHQYAEHQPIIDYHCHLSPKDIAQNRRFRNLAEVWLEEDHYKWRAMRANGVPERYCTGDAEPYEKFMAWARTVPYTLRNPLYHWMHLELKRNFGIDQLLDERSAPAIWEEANALLATEALRPHSILQKFRVKALCTTDDPSDDLQYHKQLAGSSLATRVCPTFRLDKALNLNPPEIFNPWVDRLAAASNIDIVRFSDFLAALRRRHDDFHQLGCRLSDHSLKTCHAEFCPESAAAAIFAKIRSGQPATAEEFGQYVSFMTFFFAHLDAEKGWTHQLRVGVFRNVNTRCLREYGPDTGFDTIGDWPQVESLVACLDRLDREHSLPKTILYNLNPADNYLLAAMAGNFQNGAAAGKIQYGSGWWFLDQKEGITMQINALSNVGLLSRFIGMLTDSRSFMSYPRHEYFRRVLCNLLGADIENGELPNDMALIGSMVQRICYENAREYLGLGIPA